MSGEREERSEVLNLTLKLKKTSATLLATPVLE